VPESAPEPVIHGHIAPLFKSAALTARFEPRRKLGRGGFGVVYEVLDRTRNAAVALKLMHRRDPGAIYLFKHEFRSLAEIVHPNLVRLYELGSDGEAWWFTMELVNGVDARAYVKSAPNAAVPFNEDRLRSLLLQLAEGLGYLHSAGKLHRDVKPSNVIAANDG